MEGSNLFWSSGTWVFFLGQAMVVLLVVFLYRHLGKKEKQARQDAENSQNN